MAACIGLIAGVGVPIETAGTRRRWSSPGNTLVPKCRFGAPRRPL